MLGDIANGLTVDFVVHWKGDGNDDDYDYDIMTTAIMKHYQHA
jgi:hypothetical protein